MTDSKALQPEITNVSDTAWSNIKTRWLFWLVVVVAILSAIFFFSIWPLFAILFYYMIAVNKVRSSFWKQFARINGWQYKGIVDSDGQPGVMFKQGEGPGTFDNLIEGSVEGRGLRIFQYQFSVKKDSTRQSFFYTVFAFKFNGSFPNIYLNNKHNSYGMSIGEHIPLPLEFEKQFSLSAPREYEIEALEIFTPDVLVKLLDNGFTHDVEFIGQEVLMFVDGNIDNLEKLKEEFNRAVALEKLLEEKLDRFKFQQIGNMPTTL